MIDVRPEGVGRENVLSMLTKIEHGSEIDMTGQNETRMTWK
jgi:hypothetical protein